MSETIYLATHEDGAQTLVRLWSAPVSPADPADNYSFGEVASRVDRWSTWSAPTPLVSAP